MNFFNVATLWSKTLKIVGDDGNREKMGFVACSSETVRISGFQTQVIILREFSQVSNSANSMTLAILIFSFIMAKIRVFIEN